MTTLAFVVLILKQRDRIPTIQSARKCDLNASFLILAPPQDRVLRLPLHSQFFKIFVSTSDPVLRRSQSRFRGFFSVP